MNRFVLALAAFIALAPIAALAQDQPQEAAQAQISVPAPNDAKSAVPDYVFLDIGGN